MLNRSVGGRWLLWAAAACVLAFAGMACAEEIPALEFAFGQPAIEPTHVLGYYGGWPPAMAADESSIYVAGKQINVFSREGEWLEFWPFSSIARGIGDALEGDSDWATGIALGPGGRVYLLGQAYAAVHAYGTDGEFLGGWGGHGDAPGEFHYPTAICASSDSSVYVLDRSPTRIVRFTADGALLNEWAIPDAADPYVMQALSIAPAAGEGIWLLRAVGRWEEETGTWLMEVRLHRFGADGTEETSWAIPPGPSWSVYELATDPAGNVWVADGGGDTGDRLRSYSPSGMILSQVTLAGGPFRREFAISPDGKLVLMRVQSFEGSVTWGRYVVHEVQTRSLDGELLGSFGNPYDMMSTGTLMAPLAVAEDIEGGTYVKVGWGDSSYIVRYDSDGEQVAVLDTEEWPVTDPSTGTVEFVPGIANYVGPDGAYWYCPRDIYLREVVIRGQVMERRWVADVYRCSAASGVEELAFRIPVGDMLPEAFLGGLVSWWGVVQQTDDGNLVLAMELWSWTEEPGVLWVAALTPGGTVLSWWTTPDPELLLYPVCAARDGGGNTYIGGDGVWKLGPAGELIGRIGGWGGEGDQRDALGSLVLWANKLLIDSEGRLTVLDSEANRVVVFRYTPGPFEDVPFYHWAKDSVIDAVDADVIAGYDDGLFRPAEEITRAQLAAFLARAMAGGDGKVPAGPVDPSFEDVPADYWAYRYVEYMLAHGVVDMPADGLYEPDGSVDRGDMAVFVARAMAGGDAGVPSGPAAPSFADVGTDDATYKYVEYLKQQGVVLGYADGYYHPEYLCLRDQVAVYVARAWIHP